ncbi:MAG: histidinol dehydrogenase [Magnetococcales bacterium]|nr:histidinol dehydrogenase [Magnetococcales bacterium]MBF0156380.1 histidinol dehydrogenase [Magnetococcales bacterium]
MRRLDTRQHDFARRFEKLLLWQEDDLREIERSVAGIIADVRQRGDEALLEYTRTFDRFPITRETLAFSAAEADAAMVAADAFLVKTLESASRRIWDYHRWQMPTMGVSRFEDRTGVTLGQRLTPLARVGIYVPGGLASYPSTVLMNAIPARVAGVGEVVMVTPTPEGRIDPLILAAARLAGVDRIFRIGGAQAIAALAFGTDTVPAVDKIVGPGNHYVATAKRQLFGRVGIDMLAGPSEILVIADRDNDPSWLAADLLSQAEHDPSAQAILITDHSPLADAVEEELKAHLELLSRRDICRKSLADRGAIIVARDLQEACRLASQAAPEHLELAVADPEAYYLQVRSAGAIFLGRYTPEAIGDYVAGPSHVLPTGGSARFSSPLGVHDFIKRTSLIGCSPAALRGIGPAASRLARAEGLSAHRLSLDLRLLDLDPVRREPTGAADPPPTERPPPSVPAPSGSPIAGHPGLSPVSESTLAGLGVAGEASDNVGPGPALATLPLEGPSPTGNPGQTTAATNFGEASFQESP